MLKHFVTTWYPGTFFSEKSTHEVKSRDPKEFKLPRGAYCFQFHDVETATIDGGEALMGRPKNHSPEYIVGKKLTLDEVLPLYGEDSILVRNMKCNNWNAVVECPQGMVPVRENTVVIALEDARYEEEVSHD